MDNIIVSIAKEKDIDELAILLDMLFTQEVEFCPDEEKQKEGLRLILKNPQYGVIFVAKSNNKIIGMVSLLFTISTAMGSKVGVIEDLIIKQTYRNKGVGSMLLDALISYSKEINIPRLTLLTDEINYKAQEFYSRFGFELSSMRTMRKMIDLN